MYEEVASSLKIDTLVSLGLHKLHPLKQYENTSEMFYAVRSQEWTALSKAEAAARTIKAKVPYMLKEHKKQIAQILGVLENVDPESLNILQIVKGITEMLNDKALLQLFSSAVLTEEEAPLTEDCNK